LKGKYCEEYMDQHMRGAFWGSRWNKELYTLYNEPNIVKDIKIGRLEWADHIIMEEERIPKKVSKRKLSYHKTSGKTKN
jgi:hypothetical protein